MDFIPDDEQHYKRVCVEVFLEVKPAEVKLEQPSASTITYEQSLAYSKLTGGYSTVSGHFEFTHKDYIPSAGRQLCEVSFISDYRSYYKTVTNYIYVDVKQASPKILRYPEVSDIFYGQSFADVYLHGGLSDVYGTWFIKNLLRVLPVGDYTVKAVFMPSDIVNYKNTGVNICVHIKKHRLLSFPYRKPTIAVKVTAKKADPKLTIKEIETDYKPETYLRNISLPQGWRWKNTNTLLDCIGDFEFIAVNDGDSNYKPSQKIVVETVNKSEPTLSLPGIIYNLEQKLKNINLPTGLHRINENIVPKVSSVCYAA